MTTRRSQPTKATIDQYGVADTYLDARGQWQRSPESTRRAICKAMGADGAQRSNGKPNSETGPIILRRGATSSNAGIQGPFDLRLEDGTELKSQRKIPRDIPLGYHTLEVHGTTSTRRLIATPSECFLPQDLRVWGWAVQLYSLRSKQSWGIGDLADLRGFNHWTKQFDAGITLINPLGADTPGFPSHASPYAPSSRCFRNLLYLSLENIPGADRGSAEFKKAIAAGRALNAKKTIDRDAVLKLKLSVLERVWGSFSGDEDFDSYCAEQGESLTNFCRFCALAEKHGRDWRVWPGKYRHPESAAVRAFAQQHARRVQFFAWIQWLIDRQLAEAAREVPLMQDFPIGVDPRGADAWIWQDVFASGVSAGVPPDLYNQSGQNWGLNVFIPHKLRAAGYAPFIQTIRALLRYAGGLRIDHVMGLYRLFWIPDGVPAAQGAYVHYPTDDLLAILALESHRAGAIIVGEDLGTVDIGARQKFMDHGLLSYRLMWFEEHAPQKFPRQSLASVSTHDLPTIAGLWTGQDERDEAKAGLRSNTAGWKAMRDRLRRQIKATPKMPVAEVIHRTYKSLAKAPSVIITATLEDACAVPHRPNMPGTVDTWPNWSQPLPGGLEAIEKSELARSIAADLQGRAGQPSRANRKCNLKARTRNEMQQQQNAGQDLADRGPRLPAFKVVQNENDNPC